MAKDPNPNLDSELAASPSVDPKTHTVNPSAPTTGTEGWGLTADERRTLAVTEPEASQPGQVKRDAGAASVNVTHQGNRRTFHCADMGNADCRWETSGESDEEIMEQVREHAQTVHGWNDWTDALRNRVRDAIRERPAA